MISADGILSVRDASVGGDVLSSVIVQPPNWTDGAHLITLLIHGYNNNEEEAKQAYGKLLAQLETRPLSKIGCFHWPGDAEFGSLQAFDFLSYPTEIPDAKASAKVLAKHLQNITRESNCSVEFNLVGHSMGCRLIVELLDEIAANADPVVSINLIMLMAAAIPVELMAPESSFETNSQSIKDRLILFSDSDPVLQFAFPAGQELATAMGTDQGPYFEAVGRYGNPSSYQAERFNRNGNSHGAYWSDKTVGTELKTRLGIAFERVITRYETCKFASVTAAKLQSRKIDSRHTPRW